MYIPCSLNERRHFKYFATNKISTRIVLDYTDLRQCLGLLLDDHAKTSTPSLSRSCIWQVLHFQSPPMHACRSVCTTCERRSTSLLMLYTRGLQLSRCDEVNDWTTVLAASMDSDRIQLDVAGAGSSMLTDKRSWHALTWWGDCPGQPRGPTLCPRLWWMARVDWLRVRRFSPWDRSPHL